MLPRHYWETQVRKTTNGSKGHLKKPYSLRELLQDQLLFSDSTYDCGRSEKSGHWASVMMNLWLLQLSAESWGTH